MAAPSTTNTVLDNTPWHYAIRCQATFGSSQETNVVKIDPTSLPDLIPTLVPKLNLIRATWNISGAGHVLVKFDATSPVTAKDLTGSGTFDALLGTGVPVYNEPQAAGSTGKILFTTTGFASSDTYDVVLHFEKDRSRFSTAPVVSALNVIDLHSGVYLTGDTLRVKATFNQVVNLESATSGLDFSLASGTIRATYKGKQTLAGPLVTGEGTKYAVFEYTFKASDHAEASDVTCDHIKGVFGTDVAALKAQDSLPAITGIASFTVNSVI